MYMYRAENNVVSNIIRSHISFMYYVVGEREGGREGREGGREGGEGREGRREGGEGGGGIRQVLPLSLHCLFLCRQ